MRLALMMTVSAHKNRFIATLLAAIAATVKPVRGAVARNVERVNATS
jgi:hypothetical protein